MTPQQRRTTLIVTLIAVGLVGLQFLRGSLIPTLTCDQIEESSRIVAFASVPGDGGSTDLDPGNFLTALCLTAVTETDDGVEVDSRLLVCNRTDEPMALRLATSELGTGHRLVDPLDDTIVASLFETRDVVEVAHVADLAVGTCWEETRELLLTAEQAGTGAEVVLEILPAGGTSAPLVLVSQEIVELPAS